MDSPAGTEMGEALLATPQAPEGAKDEDSYEKKVEGVDWVGLARGKRTGPSAVTLGHLAGSGQSAPPGRPSRGAMVHPPWVQRSRPGAAEKKTKQKKNAKKQKKNV